MTYLRARYYSHDMHRFISEDPHWNVDNMIYGDNGSGNPDMSAIIQSSNLYVYSSNNSIRYFDPTGMIEYEKFNTIEEALKDWAWNHFSESYYVGFECAAIVYMKNDENGNIYYSYTWGTWGGPHNVYPQNITKYVPKGGLILGPIHYHPNRAGFSDADIGFSKQQHWTSAYVVYKDSDGVKIDKWADSRRGYKITTITNVPVSPITNERKAFLRNYFQDEWYYHVQYGCNQGGGCESMTWPRE